MLGFCRGDKVLKNEMTLSALDASSAISSPRNQCPFCCAHLTVELLEHLVCALSHLSPLLDVLRRQSKDMMANVMENSENSPLTQYPFSTSNSPAVLHTKVHKFSIGRTCLHV